MVLGYSHPAMAVFLLRRLLDLVPTIIGVSMAVFLIVRLVPGDPARLIAGTDAKEEDIVQIRRQLGLDEPVPVQYARFVAGVVTGDFGRSLRNRQPVTTLIAARLPATLQLAGASLLVTLLVGLPIGVLAAVRRGGLLDTASMVVALLGVSVPGFGLGLGLIWLFAVNLRWLPTSGDGTPAHLVLPALTLGAASTAIVARMTRAGLLEALSQEYVRTARAKGLPERAVLLGHALRNALIPTITVVGLQLGFLLAGSVVTETVFAWPGVGRLLVESVLVRDYPMIQAIVLLFSVIFLLSSLLVDLGYGLLDPRIRVS